MADDGGVLRDALVRGPLPHALPDKGPEQILGGDVTDEVHVSPHFRTGRSGHHPSMPSPSDMSGPHTATELSLRVQVGWLAHGKTIPVWIVRAADCS